MNDQLQDLLDRFDDVIQDDTQDLPRMPFKSSYFLDRVQEDGLIEHVKDRIDKLENELGRDTIANGDWFDGELESATDGIKPERTFMGKRRLYDLIYQNQVAWRAAVKGGIFAESNLTIPLARRIARQMTSRANNYFFGSDPYFAINPIGVDDKELAHRAHKYTIHKSESANTRATMESSVERAFIVGEGVVKTTHVNKEQPYQKFETVLVDENGEPLFASDQDYITEQDLWIEGENGLVLKRDGGLTPQPSEMVFEEVLTNRRIRQEYGPNQELIHFQDFLCPLNAKNIDVADCVVHLYNISAMDLADMWAKRGAINLNPNEHEEVTQKAIEALRLMANNNDENDDNKREVLGEGDKDSKMQSTSMVEIAEVYIRYDANGDGIMEDIMIMMDRKNGIPIYYDHLANVTPDGKRPFSVVRINKNQSYWHGQGAIEMFETTQEVVDLLVNRWNFSQTSAARVDFFNPAATTQGDSNPHLELNSGQTYTLKPGKKAEDALQSVVLYDAKSDNLNELLELFMQVAMNESGVQHANDSSMVGLDSQKLATGIRNVEKSSQEMFSTYLSDLEPGCADILQKFKNCLYYYMDPEEVLEFFDNDTRAVLRIAAEDVMDLDLHIQLVMTRQNGQQMIEQNIQSSQFVQEFYAVENPNTQDRIAPFYQDILRGYNVKNPEEIIQAVANEMPAQPTQPSADSEQIATATAPEERVVEPNI